ncbi:MAG: dicarboxylate/amino acid:cation symporter [Kiritimatiellae bacterium]|nr:dicarboxylate/amino acid:cation symporter [Kiritimatiellia bacterium]
MESGKKNNLRQLAAWTAALVIGAALGAIGSGALDGFMNFVASAYTRLFQFVAVPTIALAVATTLASLGARKNTGRLFLHTISYTLLTTFAAALVGLGLYIAIRPGNLPADIVAQNAAAADAYVPETLYGHILNAIPNNAVRPFFEGNVLSILFIAAAVGLGLASMPDSDGKSAVSRVLFGAQELLFTLIRGLVRVLPLGIVAFSAQLSAQVKAGMIVGSLGKYLAVVLAGNAVQFFIVLPLFLVVRGINPLRVLKAMSPAVLMALFTKSSAATLPVTVSSAENNLRAKPEVARFVCPICCTINMNGCAAFILVTSLFVMQNGGVALTASTMFAWVLIACISAIGNAGVPMGCYFLTLSLMVGQGMPVGILGVILPVYAVIDMIETAENVWSDSCVCAMVDKDLGAAG